MCIVRELQTSIYSKMQAFSVPVYSNGAVPDNDVARYAVIVVFFKQKTAYEV